LLGTGYTPMSRASARGIPRGNSMW